MESLTDQIESKPEEYIPKIDDMGGVIRAIEAGYVQQEIADSAYTYQKDVESGDQVVVGVNKYQIQEEGPTDLLLSMRLVQGRLNRRRRIGLG